MDNYMGHGLSVIKLWVICNEHGRGMELEMVNDVIAMLTLFELHREYGTSAAQHHEYRQP